MLKETKLNNLTKIKGILTSQIWTRKSSDTPYYAFLRVDDNQKHSRKVCERTKCQECEIPVIFRLSSQAKPYLDKDNQVILQGNWAKSDHNSRPSFTAYSYQTINE